jgi:predicted ribosome quality control (RQC) complex YloA/Tae2 family protein
LPSRNEISGKPFSIAIASETNSRSKIYSIRELDFPGPFWQRIEHFYKQSGGRLSRESLLENAHEIYEKKKSALEARLLHLESIAKEYDEFERFRQLGDILLSGYSIENDGKKSCAHALDFYAHEEILIEIDPKLSPAQNSAVYYEKYHKAKNGILETHADLSRTADSLEQLRDWIAQLDREADPLALAKVLRKGGTVRTKEKSKYPCMYLDYKGWMILIGRSGKDNDEILRHYCKGNDLWLHARDYSGAYVFIQSRKNKSIPPEVLQAAAKLAIYYSKARKNLGGNVHSTFAKNLKRVKDGPIGMVVPYLEKNLYITFTEAAMRNIFELSKNARGEENDQ